ncbi:peptidoglycan DD-metalloendopeptidase family protein [Gloeocapsopsis crepidinum LEGE 06123]|uniref:Peptidoglycan DD-metalloendopeptidase family protein n=1 Tax=Gloeocapsopsis crepidinum LEGE 06123 TaxID=588587 RepID=A0ABR9UUS2_9CHRO|nr:M23 family metallopeptidase [Gloeocapsopsis crepidinum]MBE9191788.1 peptidoglycan DD-metalloendopeptidase family protein [Gloeocapsopsis crepidinum LEGE 06123]
MNQRNENANTPSSYLRRHSLLLPSLTLGIVSLLSHKPGFAQESIDIVIPVKESQPALSTAPAADAHQARVERLRQKLASPAVPVKPEVSSATSPVPSASTPVVPTVQTQPRQSTTRQTATNPTPDSSKSHIDPTDYSIGATKVYEPPSAVVLSERSTGCRAVVRSGQDAASVCSMPNRPQAATRTPKASNQIASVSPVLASRTQLTKASDAQKPPAYIQQAIALVNQSISPSTQAYYNRTLRQGQLSQRNTGLLFPLTIPAPITSLFGWRIHPISGDRRFHTGTDLGAPMGTPVLAAYKGKVGLSDFLGGYGLTVVLEHELAKNKNTAKSPSDPLPHQTLYAHLSETFVKPGEKVEQGTVIGLVGSTGNSTGPHLHFESRYLTSDGWVASDPGFELEYALTQLVEVLKTARSQQETERS